MEKTESIDPVTQAFDLSPPVKAAIKEAHAALAEAAKLGALYHSVQAELQLGQTELLTLKTAQTDADVAFRIGAADRNAAALEKARDSSINAHDEKARFLDRLQLTGAALAMKAKAADDKVRAMREEIKQAQQVYALELRALLSEEMREALRPLVAVMARAAAAFLAIRSADQLTQLTDGVTVVDPDDHLRPMLSNGRFKLEDDSTVTLADLAAEESISSATKRLKPLADVMSELATHLPYNAPRPSQSQLEREKEEREREARATADEDRRREAIRNAAPTMTGHTLGIGAQ